MRTSANAFPSVLRYSVSPVLVFPSVLRYFVSPVLVFPLDPAGSSGVTYTVLRQLPGEATFALLATTGEKKYVDITLPRAMDGVQYAVQSQRGRKLGGRSASIEVKFGSIANMRASAASNVA